MRPSSLVPFRPRSERASVEELLRLVGAGAREMVTAVTRALVKRSGGRGSCILIDERAQVVFSTEAPDLTTITLDLTLYPEIAAALASREVIAIEDVKDSSLLHPVADLLPDRLRAVAVVPLVVGDRCLGVIMAQSDRPLTWVASDVAEARLEGRLAATLLDLQFGRELGQGLRPRSPRRRATPASADVLARITGRAAPAARRTRLLIAEDDLDQAAEMRELLTYEGFEVVLASNGADALREAQQLRPDLILMDVCMPILNGFDAAEQLVNDARTSSVPILMLSAGEDLLIGVRGLKVDTVDFLRKPYSMLELLTRIERSLNQAAAREHMRLEASIDDLTGLGNQRYLRERLVQEQSRIARYGTPSAIVMVDVDKFKEINDRYGHPAGSRILKAIGQALRHEIRDTDLAARYGGDEFVIVLPHTTANEGCAFAERVLRSIRELRPEGAEISLSMGVAALSVEGAGGESVDLLLAQSDAAAYRAKRAGGNQVCVFDGTLDLVLAEVESAARDRKPAPQP